MADNDAAFFLDLDNLFLGARDANLHFDINLILDAVKAHTGGRIVLRRAYTGNLQQDRKLMQMLSEAGFSIQSSVALNNYGKNLVDMMMVVDAMATLVDGRTFHSYVLATADRDFLPLVHNLRHRGKEVIGVGLRRATSEGLPALCDRYIYYDDLSPVASPDRSGIETLLRKALGDLAPGDEGVRASVLQQRMVQLSEGGFGRRQLGGESFTQFLGRFSDIVQLEKSGTTTFVHEAEVLEVVSAPTPALYARYRTDLKKRKLRVVPAPLRLLMLSRMLDLLDGNGSLIWQDLVKRLAAMSVTEQRPSPSRNMANALLVVARDGGVIRTESAKRLSAAPVSLALNGSGSYQEVIKCCDVCYLQAIRALDAPFDLDQAAIALYDSPDYAPYLRSIAG